MKTIVLRNKSDAPVRDGAPIAVQDTCVEWETMEAPKPMGPTLERPYPWIRVRVFSATEEFHGPHQVFRENYSFERHA
jgi:hypothetical protein